MGIKEAISTILGKEEETEHRMTSRQLALSKRQLQEQVLGEVYANHVGKDAPVPDPTRLRTPEVNIPAYMGFPPKLAEPDEN